MGSSLKAYDPEGFLGVAERRPPVRYTPLSAVGRSFSWFGETAALTIKGTAAFFSPSSLSEYADRVFHTTPGRAQRIELPETRRGASSAATERDANRITSIVGAVALGSELTRDGFLTLLPFFALLNMAIGILNLIPLPPFDGGHVAIGTYEKIREMLRRDGRRYLVDYRKVMPVAAAVVTFMLVVGAMAIYLDLVDPISL
ncbi:MAG: site-2 protease family protein [Microthrixaceae bacterium]